MEATDPMKGSIQSKLFPILMLLNHGGVNESRILYMVITTAEEQVGFKVQAVYNSDTAGNSLQWFFGQETRSLAGFPMLDESVANSTVCIYSLCIWMFVRGDIWRFIESSVD